MTMENLISEFWEKLVEDQTINEELFDGVDDFTIQETLNSPRDGKRPTEYLCSLTEDDAVIALEWIVVHGGKVTDDCYREALRSGENLKLLKPLVTSGHFPLVLGTTFVLDWIVSSYNTDTTTEESSEEVQIKVRR